MRWLHHCWVFSRLVLRSLLESWLLAWVWFICSLWLSAGTGPIFVASTELNARLASYVTWLLRGGVMTYDNYATNHVHVHLYRRAYACILTIVLLILQHWLLPDHIQLVPHNLCGQPTHWSKLILVLSTVWNSSLNIPIFYDHIEFFFPNDCFFAHNIYHCSSQTMLRIWDTFLYEGSKVLFRFAIAIFKYNEEALLSKDNSIAIFNHLRTMCQEATDVNKLVDVSQW